MNLSENINRQGFYFDSTKGVVGGNTRRHYHENFELYFLEKGTCNYFVDNRFYNLREGDLIYIPQNRAHQTDYTRDVHSRKLINCSIDYIPEDALAEIGNESLVFRNPDTLKEISEIFDLVEKECATHDKFSDNVIKYHMGRLFYVIARHKQENKASLSENKIMERVVEYIGKNFMHEITLSEIARQNAVSAEHLSRIFKKELGVGFSEYLNNIRLQRAEFMLKNEEGRSISKIAYACGFNDSNYFSYRFKKVYGVSPISIKKKTCNKKSDGTAD